MQAQNPDEQPNQPLQVCPICFKDVQLDAPVETCAQCRGIYHRNCIVNSLRTRYNAGNKVNCPNCHVKMAWILYKFQLVRQCCFCHEIIGPNVRVSFCHYDHCAYHENELRYLVEEIREMEQPLLCLGCGGDISWALNLPPAPALDYTTIQPAEQNSDIDNSDSDSDLEDESESDF